MIQNARQHSLKELLSSDAKVHFLVPKYQREYAWKRDPNWEDLMNDLNENDEGYFLGSIICIKLPVDSHAPYQTLEVVDGQQRLLTVSLLLAAIFKFLGQEDQKDPEVNYQKTDLMKLLINEKTQDFICEPQMTNSNKDDYRRVMESAGIQATCGGKPNGHKRIVKAYKYFEKQIKESLEGSPHDKKNKLIELARKVTQAVIVKIEVGSHADAHVLFESLNKRGAPLSAVDLIKNKLLSCLDRGRQGKKNSKTSHDIAIRSWEQLIQNLGAEKDSAPEQERFFRHYYNAFAETKKLSSITGHKVARKSNLIQIYEKLLEKQANETLKDMVLASSLYGLIVGNPSFDEGVSELAHSFRKLAKIKGAPSYALLLNLLSCREDWKLNENNLRLIVELLVKFFVRRNLTGLPSTNTLTMLPTTILESLKGKTGKAVVDTIRAYLLNKSVDNTVFQTALEGNIYEDNSEVTWLVLCSLCDVKGTRETPEVWREENGKVVWSVEHILPQGDLSKDWIKDLGGRKEAALKVQQELVHKLGNLTLSRYNSELSNLSFTEKKDRIDGSGNWIGYRNNLAINCDVVMNECWTAEQIEERGKKLVAEAVKIFDLET